METTAQLLQSPHRPRTQDTGTGDEIRLVLFVGSSSSAADSILVALEREYPSVRARRADHLASICRSFEHPVAVVVLDPRSVSELNLAASQVASWHPDATIAVMDRHIDAGAISFGDIVTSGRFRAVLPMDMRLDLWLAVMGLLLKGGEYYSPAVIRTHVVPRPLHGEGTAPPGAESDKVRQQVASLTRRELQILSMVSEGLQNKAIASEFGLSEHTVKVHLHNIISKLGTKNRTEAATLYRRGRRF